MQYSLGLEHVCKSGSFCHTGDRKVSQGSRSLRATDGLSSAPQTALPGPPHPKLPVYLGCKEDRSTKEKRSLPTPRHFTWRKSSFRSTVSALLPVLTFLTSSSHRRSWVLSRVEASCAPDALPSGASALPVSQFSAGLFIRLCILYHPHPW